MISRRAIFLRQQGGAVGSTCTTRPGRQYPPRGRGNRAGYRTGCRLPWAGETVGRKHARFSPKIWVMTDMTKWEYATVPLLTHATKQILDTWGEDGWELVTVMPGPNPENVVAYMKRPRKD